MQRQEIKIVFTLPDEDDRILQEEHRPFLEWILQTVAISRAQGLGCDVYVDGQLYKVEIVHVPPKGTVQ